MGGFLTEQDTMFGTIAFRNKLITKEQLSEGVMQLQAHSDMRLGEVLQKMGYLSAEQVQAVLDMQFGQRKKIQEQQPPPPMSAAPEPQVSVPREPQASGKPEPVAAEPQSTAAEGSTSDQPPANKPGSLGIDFSMPGVESDQPSDPPPSSSPPESRVQSETPSASGDSLFDGESNMEDLQAAAASTREEENVPPPQPVAPPSRPEPPVRPAAAPPPPQPAPRQASQVPTGSAGGLYNYLRRVREMEASDLHISAEVNPFVRKASRLQDLESTPLNAAQTEQLLFGVLSKQQKTHLLQNHSLEFCLDVPGEGRYRSTIIKQRCGFDGIFRVIRSTVPSMEDLALPDCLKRLTEYNQGLVLVTGPGNSGKTTTLAAMLDAINRERTDHIITVEEPVEYIHQANLCQVTQREVGVHTESFSVALRAALREDPDVIMVGELRDLETLSMAITASETGHLVFGTLHTTSATSTVGRVVDAFPVGQQAQIRMMVSESLRGVLSQQLVPRTDGGVALALEILFVTPAVGALIRDNQPHQITSVMQTSRKMGMCRMDDSLMELVNAGVIDGMEAYRRAVNKKMFERFKNASQ